MTAAELRAKAVVEAERATRRRERGRLRARRYRAALRAMQPCVDCDLPGRLPRRQVCAACADVRAYRRRIADRERRRERYRERVQRDGGMELERRRRAQQERYRRNPEHAREMARERMRRLREARYRKGLDATGKPRGDGFELARRGGKTRGHYLEHGRKAHPVQIVSEREAETVNPE